MSVLPWKFSVQVNRGCWLRMGAMLVSKMSREHVTWAYLVVDALVKEHAE
jgi:hypothetical protein